MRAVLAFAFGYLLGVVLRRPTSDGVTASDAMTITWNAGQFL